MNPQANIDEKNAVIKVTCHPDHPPLILSPDDALRLAARLLVAARGASSARTRLTVENARTLENPTKQKLDALKASKMTRAAAAQKLKENHRAFMDRMVEARSEAEKAIRIFRGGEALPPPAPEPEPEPEEDDTAPIPPLDIEDPLG